MPRDIVVVSTKTNSKKTVASNAETWGALKSDLSHAGIDYKNMNVIIRETKNNLVDDAARLPEGTFTLFLLPVKVKSGNGLASLVNSLTEQLTKLDIGPNPIIKQIEVTVHASSDTIDTAIAISTRIKQPCPDCNDREKAEKILQQPGAQPEAQAEPAADTPTPPPTPAAEAHATPPPTPPTAPSKPVKVTDKMVEEMKAEAKKLGLSIKMKLAKSDPKYNATYQKLFDAAKAEHFGKQGTVATPVAETPATLPSKAEPARTIIERPEQKEEKLDDLLAEARQFAR